MVHNYTPSILVEHNFFLDQLAHILTRVKKIRDIINVLEGNKFALGDDSSTPSILLKIQICDNVFPLIISLLDQDDSHP